VLDFVQWIFFASLIMLMLARLHNMTLWRRAGALDMKVRPPLSSARWPPRRPARPPPPPPLFFFFGCFLALCLQVHGCGGGVCVHGWGWRGAVRVICPVWTSIMPSDRGKHEGHCRV
jgi:hypothetical protein